MRRLSALLILISLSAATLRLGAAPPPKRPFEAATDAWERGDYIAALNGYIQVLSGAGGDAFFEPIALTTGELFETRELTADGRAPRFSPDNKYIVYETGLETSRRTRILRNDAVARRSSPICRACRRRSRPRSTRSPISRFPRTTRSGARRTALEQASLTAQNRNQLTQTLTWLIARHSAIVVRDLRNGREMELPAPELLKTGLVFNADGRELYFLGAREVRARSHRHLRDQRERAEAGARRRGRRLEERADRRSGGQGAALCDPRRRTRCGGPRNRGREGRERREGLERREGQERAGQAGGGRGGQAERAAAVRDRRYRHAQVSTIVGSAPSLSATGGRSPTSRATGAEYSVMVGPTTGIADRR